MILSVASQKGGTGKTTTSISLAAGLARRGRRTLLIDTDSQASSASVITVITTPVSQPTSNSRDYTKKAYKGKDHLG